MSFLSKIISGNKFGEWDEYISNIPDKSVKKHFSDIVRYYYIPDEIDRNKFLGNLQILKYHDRKLASVSTRLNNESDFTPNGTQSIDKLAGIGNKPLGYYDWFIAGYPDVVNWAMDLDDAELIKITGIIDPENEKEFFDEENKFKDKYLRKLVDKFKEEKNMLECRKVIKK